MKFRHLLALATCITALSGCANNTPIGRSLAISSSEWASKAEFWVFSHQEPSGALPYFFDPAVDREIGKRHAFGELIAAHRIAQLASQRPRLAEIHSAQMAAILSSVNPSGNPRTLAIDHNNLATMGVNALLLRLLLESSDQAYDASTHAESIADQLTEAWDESTGFPEYLDGQPTKSDYLRRYYTGIAALALVEHYEATQNESSLQVALKAIHWLERAYPARDHKSFHPSPTPWLVEALGKMNGLRPQQDLQERIFDLADHFVALQDTEFFPGRFWSPKGPNFGPPNTVRDAQATRALLTALELAVDLEKTRPAKRYRRALVLALDNLRAHQYDAGGVETFPTPAGAVGAVRFRYDRSVIRIDGVILTAMAFEEASKLAWQGKL
mgnify:CR=1 FL=1